MRTYDNLRTDLLIFQLICLAESSCFSIASQATFTPFSDRTIRPTSSAFAAYVGLFNSLSRLQIQFHDLDRVILIPMR